MIFVKTFLLQYYVSETYTTPDEHDTLPLFAYQKGSAPAVDLGGPFPLSLSEYKIDGWMCGRYVVLQAFRDGILEFREVEVYPPA